jgi:hypothetical protein
MLRVYYGVQKIQIPLEDSPSNLKYALIPLAAIASPPPNTQKNVLFAHHLDGHQVYQDDVQESLAYIQSSNVNLVDPPKSITIYHILDTRTFFDYVTNFNVHNEILCIVLSYINN